jgi:hypothetical protein
MVLARFGYRLDMKVGGKKKKKKKSIYILGYQLELIIKVWLFGKINKNKI